MTIETGGPPETSGAETPDRRPDSTPKKRTAGKRRKRARRRTSRTSRTAGKEPGARRWEPLFFRALRKYREIGLACEAVGIGRTTVHDRRHRSKEFDRLVVEELHHRVDVLANSVWQRASEGWLEPVFYQGKRCGSVRKFSNTLAIFMLKAHGGPEYRFAEEAERESELNRATAIRDFLIALRARVPDAPPPAPPAPEVTPEHPPSEA